DAEQITVHTFDRREYQAELVGNDPTTDIAVIKIDADGLETLSFGSSDGVRVGEWVLAVGNPGFGDGSQLDYTVTAGIVSAKSRPLNIVTRELLREFEDQNLAAYGIENFIQTDAVINPGNSGGPLVDLRGQVVGVNTAIVSRSGFYQGYGFAIPVDLARRVMEDLIEYGRVRRAWLGVSITLVTSVDAEAYGLPRVAGAIVQDFPDGSPAREAGLEREDVITAVNGDDVAGPGDLQQKVAQLRPGETAILRVYRDGAPRTLEVELGQAPISAEPERVTEATEAAGQKLGIMVQELTPDLAQRLGYDRAEGVVVSRVQPGSPAWERGLPQGWMIQEINGHTVESTADVEDALSRVEPGAIVAFRLVDPDGTYRVVNVRMPG
ncbi:MAG: PDZ domain-containing protein, partial [Gemmatimonadetes bacterium]|nr:PDZ domain-containing protein [Gemmatimonadota bacterium]NIR79577.1 PDZ domain-containing protein [Gemmatimonadota bacterium]NIT88268.1 PDZ domain-containing protein [Gemmatimonadota bacterium]NIU32066.1 PDZ domain-containing protein [Gemmatimonadota bacterium]NIU36666.1 PDZ domain-containing protein [Gemmatimonadota bacterium]